VHKHFYASGFLYHSPTQQILLQQFDNGENVKLTLFRGKSLHGDDPLAVFQHTVEETLGIPVDRSKIHPVYDYIHDKLGEHFIFYIEVTEISPAKFAANSKAEWIPLSKLSKQMISEQTRHDIIVGERVIRSLFEAAHPREDPRTH
jgi:hypothetical protein